MDPCVLDCLASDHHLFWTAVCFGYAYFFSNSCLFVLSSITVSPPPDPLIWTGLLWITVCFGQLSFLDSCLLYICMRFIFEFLL